jgi:EAL domain-containing protein (putative c-di-GMP-specific phosphodiesterase class I)
LKRAPPPADTGAMTSAGGLEPDVGGTRRGPRAQEASDEAARGHLGVLAGDPVLEFQPAVDLRTGTLVAFEALVRWDHPTKGRIPPSILIPWAEANGDIVRLNAWVLEQACREATSWPDSIRLHVNCSPVQLRERLASVAVWEALQRSGIHGSRLTVEVTERTLADPAAAHDLEAITALGVGLAVDDVGTSWSSLRPLRRFAVATLKIDESFVHDLEAEEGKNRALVETIIHVSHSLALTTVAEGIETAQQMAILREFGADVGQGFLLAPPMAAAEARAVAHDPAPYALPGGPMLLDEPPDRPGSEHPATTPVG